MPVLIAIITGIIVVGSAGYLGIGKYMAGKSNRATTTQEVLCSKKDGAKKMNMEEAKQIAAKSECGNKFLEGVVCNDNSGTWWFNLDIKKQGCSPACVIDVETKKAEINWRCTGLIIPEAGKTNTATEAPKTTAPATKPSSKPVTSGTTTTTTNTTAQTGSQATTTQTTTATTTPATTATTTPTTSTTTTATTTTTTTTTPAVSATTTSFTPKISSNITTTPTIASNGSPAIILAFDTDKECVSTFYYWIDPSYISTNKGRYLDNQINHSAILYNLDNLSEVYNWKAKCVAVDASYVETGNLTFQLEHASSFPAP